MWKDVSELLTVRFGVDIIEILLLLCCGWFADIPDKQIFFVVAAEPAEKRGKGLLITGLLRSTRTHRCIPADI